MVPALTQAGRGPNDSPSQEPALIEGLGGAVASWGCGPAVWVEGLLARPGPTCGHWALPLDLQKRLLGSLSRVTERPPSPDPAQSPPSPQEGVGVVESLGLESVKHHTGAVFGHRQ